MAKVRAPLFSLDATQSVGGALTFARHKRRRLAKSTPIPTDPHTPAQLAQRNLYGMAIEAWRALSQAQRDALRPEATKAHLPIYQYFMRTFLMALALHHETHELGGTDQITVSQ